MAAWERPDQFHRVVSFIGTFVAMKGADTMLALIRKSEPKPIRIFMQDGKNDHIVPGQPFGTFFAGSWPINNQVLYEDLQFAGYDVKYELGESGHDGTQTRRHHAGYAALAVARLSEADHRAAARRHSASRAGIRARRSSPSISIDKPWEQVGGTYKSAVSPAPDKDGNVYFADPAANVIYKSDADGKVVHIQEQYRRREGAARGR